MKFNNPYWSIKQKIQLLERWIIKHSIIYYVLDNNIVSDHKFDANCQQLMELIEKYPKEFKQTKYYEQFKNFDGSTGCDLYGKLEETDKNYLLRQAQYLVKQYGR